MEGDCELNNAYILCHITLDCVLCSVKLKSLVPHMFGANGVPAQGSVRVEEDFVKQITPLSV